MVGCHMLASMTREEVRAVAPDATLLMPTAAIEQHGPHLPLATDTLIADAITQRSGAQAGKHIPVCVAPTLAVGCSHHHLVFTALSLRSTTFQAVVADVLESAVLAGFRRIFVINAHGGNDEIVRLIARDVTLTSDVSIAANSYWTIARSAVLDMWSGAPFPGHAGTFETSLVLALAPNLVREELRPQDLDHARPLAAQGLFDGAIARHGEWSRINGYTDAPIEATADLGERILDAVTRSVTDALLAFHHATGSS
jgi:creatinine amidohydrolase